MALVGGGVGCTENTRQPVLRIPAPSITHLQETFHALTSLLILTYIYSVLDIYTLQCRWCRGGKIFTFGRGNDEPSHAMSSVVGDDHSISVTVEGDSGLLLVEST